ncbi:transmembrane protein 254-like [Conger conger]|uniref:transmembrane protein 254-like n=1 Tax=Conger conger TaxID=82655 RepID=UPI002A5ACBCE|nr:transmembrane protein 254-like [Conger conger]
MLGPLGFLSKYIREHHHSLMYNGWWLALMIHVAEALYSLKLMNKGLNNAVTFLWFVQTFLFGIASLGLLLKYQPEPLPKQH